MRRLALVGAGLVLPLLPAAPAFAADNVICVTPVSAGVVCNETFSTIAAALTEASGTVLPKTVLLGAASYPTGPLNVSSIDQLTLAGSGPATVLAMSGTAGTDTFLTLGANTVQDLTLQMPASPTGDFGIVGTAATLRRVSVDGTGTTSATGVKVQSSTVSDTSVQMPLGSIGGSTAIASRGSNVVTNVDLKGNEAYSFSASGSDTVSRARIVTDGRGVSLDSGTVDLDDAVIELSGTATGLDAANYNGATGTITLNANHLTIVGGSDTQGAHAWVGGAGSQQATINLTNSIVRGPQTSLLAEVSGSNGVGAMSNATVTVSYSDWQLATTSTDGSPNGTPHKNIDAGNVDADPAFVNPAGDYHLTRGSAVVDLGDPAASAPAVDKDGNARVTDGDGNGTAIRDMGAYELGGLVAPTPPGTDVTAPQTTITAKPHKRLTKPRARFTFASSEPGSRFRCKLDKRPWGLCTSPTRFRVKIGRHHFWVRATDAAGNTDPTPAAYSFRRVR